MLLRLKADRNDGKGKILIIKEKGSDLGSVASRTSANSQSIDLPDGTQGRQALILHVRSVADSLSKFRGKNKIV